MVPRDPVTLLLLVCALFAGASMIWIRARIVSLVTALIIVVFIMLATFAAI